MKLVLLPGLDGTGRLFSPLLPYLNNFQTQIIEYPLSGDQDYETLKNFVIKQLPKDDFIIVAESFSGPIAAMIANGNLQNIKGVIFVATFLSPPKRSFISIVRKLPLHTFIKAPFVNLFIRRLLTGKDVGGAFLENFKSVVNGIPKKIIKDRLLSIENLKIEEFSKQLPAIYIYALSDTLVPRCKGDEFKSFFPNIEFETVDASHFLLQTRPEEAAKIIDQFSSSIESV